MQLRESTQTVRSGGVQNTGQFTIKATGKAFKILSDGLYSDKPLAVVREICCNAWDAQVAAGKTDVGFRVQIPTRLDPMFYVRDHGTGLSEDDVMHLYTTYFDSNKTGSNDFTGGLGLGSKSPFSYVDQFTVTSFFEGVKTAYTAYLGEGGFPAIAKMQEGPTTECNGLEVRMPVKADDISLFQQAAEKVLPWFPVKPKVSGYSDIKLDLEYTLEGPGWKLLNDRVDRYRSSSSLRALMGNVIYPIDNTAMNTAPRHLQDMLYYPFIIEFPVGSLDVAASRESLSYDEETIKAIQERCEQVRAQVGGEVTKAMGGANSLWEAHAILHDTLETSDLKNVLGSSFSTQWQGQEIKAAGIPLRKLPSSKSPLSPEMQKVDWLATNIRVSTRSPFNPRHLNDLSMLKPIKKCRIYVVDTTGGWTAQVEYDLQINPISTAGSNWNYRTDPVYVITGEHEQLIKALGNPPYKLVSQLPLDPKHQAVQTARGPKAKKIVMSKVWEASPGKSYFHEPNTQPDLNQPGYVVCLWRGSPTRNGKETGKFDKHDFALLTQAAQELGWIPEDKFHAVPASYRNLLKQTKWVDIFEHIEKKFEEEVVKMNRLMWKNGLRDALRSSRDFPSFQTNQAFLSVIQRGGVNLTEVNRLLAARKIAATLTDDDIAKVGYMVDVSNFLDKRDKMCYNTLEFQRLKDYCTKFLDMFPLLRHIQEPAMYMTGSQETARKRQREMVEYVVQTYEYHQQLATDCSPQQGDKV